MVIVFTIKISERDNQLSIFIGMDILSLCYRLISDFLTVERNQELFEDVETVVWRDEVPEKDIYAGMISELDEAIGMIDVNQSAFTSGDVIFGGDASKWKKFGNSLKCRLAIHMSKVDSKWKQYIAEAVASGVMESNDDAAK